MHIYKIKNLPKYLNHTSLKKLIEEEVKMNIKLIYKQKTDYAIIKSEQEIENIEIAIRNNKCKISKHKNQKTIKKVSIETSDIRDRVTPLWKTSYAEQLEIKKAEIESFYKLQIIYHGTDSFYRNNCQFTFGYCDEKACLGFKGNGSNNKVYNIENCVNVSDTMKSKIDEVNKLIQDKKDIVYNTDTKLGYLRGLMVRESDFEQIALLQIHGENESNDQSTLKITDTHVNNVLKHMPFNNLYVQFYNKAFNGFIPSEIHKYSGNEYLIHEIDGFKFKISFFSFFQINAQIASKICGRITSKLAKNNLLYDLCCGSGFFGIMLHKHFEKVVGIELNESAVQDAHFNINLNKIQNYEVIKGDISNFDLDIGSALLDPPRGGVNKKFISKLRRSWINEIFYISCDYKQSYQNIKDLCKDTSNQYPNKPFLIHSIEGFDMFPNTDKSEVLIHLTR